MRYRMHVVFTMFFMTLIICFIFFIKGCGSDPSKDTYKSDLPKATTAAEAADKTETSATALSVTTAAKETSVSDKKENETQAVSPQGNPVPESDEKTEDYLDKCVFVGDSLTVGLSSYQFLPQENVIAEIGINISSVNSEKVQTAYGDMTVLEALKKASPENVYVMLGSNGIAWMNTDTMIEEYAEFLDGVSKALPDASIYIVSIPPVTASKEEAENSIQNSDIDDYNSGLLKLADSKEYHYIDLNSALKGDDGMFPDEDAADDGMHFNRSTYEKMIQFILTHVAQKAV